MPKTPKMFKDRARTDHDRNYTHLKTFHPLPWQVKPWRDKSPTLLLTGAAGGGKSVLAGEKVHAFCLKYPNSRAIVLRKSRTYMDNSTLLMLTKAIIGNDPRVKHIKNLHRFEYQNGSILSYGGMNDDNQRESIRSMSVDIAWLEEATQFDEEDYNEVLARMRGHAGSFRQIILSTNPDSPAHWVNVRLILNGEASVYYSSVRDNLHVPDSYKKELDKLTGVQYDRLVLGKWVQGVGVVYDTWQDLYNSGTGEDGGGNVTELAEYIPGGSTVIWAIDDGYSGRMDPGSGMFSAKSHPRAILMMQKQHTGRLALFHEEYAIKTLAAEHLQQAINICADMNYNLPDFIIRDRAAASLGGAIQEAGFRSTYDRIDVEEGIKEMREWITPDDNGFRMFIAHPRCQRFRYEMSSYVRDGATGRPVKEHDHGPDAARYIIWHLAYGRSPDVDIVSFSTPLVRGMYAR